MAGVGIKAFMAALKADESLQQKYEEALVGITDAANDGEAIQKAAAQLGYELSLEELEQSWAAMQSLDPDELDSVAGGQYVHNDWCFFGWYCCAVTKHTEIPADQEHTECCWSDYYCLAAWHH